MEQLAELVRVQLQTQDTFSSPKLVEVHSTAAEQQVSLTSSTRTLVRSHAWPLVGIAALELADSPLHKQIAEFAQKALAVGCQDIQLLPLFLLPGVHVMQDIPDEVAMASAYLEQAVTINLRPHLGSHPGLGQLLLSNLSTVDADATILLTHGTRRLGGNEPVIALAKQMGAVAAFWSVQPTVEEQVQCIANKGYQRIAILPYFLFTGGITDAIAQHVTHLQAQFPQLTLTLDAPLGASTQLAQLIVDLIEA